MASGVYGTKVASNITADDVEIFYSYSPTRNSNDVDNINFEKLDSNLLAQVNLGESTNGYDNLLEGVYNLKLPLQTFNKKGFYTIYVRPREVPAIINSVGVLSAYPDVKGIIVDIDGLDSDNPLRSVLNVNNELVGYRVIYFDGNGKRENYYRIVTSNNRCEPVVQNQADVNQKSIRYRYNETSSLSFITLTPSVASTFKPNEIPYIGRDGQRVVFVNTKFEPVLIEVEMVDHDADTISMMLEGSQLRDLDHGIVTTFNKNGEIYAQSEHFTLKDSMTSKPIYEIKKQRDTSIDFSQTLNDKL